MEETGKNWVYCLPLVVLNMHITPTSTGLTPFQIMYDHFYYHRTITGHDEEREETLAEYLVKMLTRLH